ncbi:Endonuclease/exonuclease/phosphatase [Macleaya cordata]|uniref:Endonuclease/exonuclease/phosphatase n=1 Tax=Macleaya cordata TaxID=56857 RepID=A0A200QRI6_MACCD|nr:Endonuclease/exonuclease/phosphatase [Macleaya cordata]
MEGLLPLTVHFTNKLDHFSQSFFGIYGPNVPRLRQDFWQELIDLYGHANNTWVLWGDFNVIRCCNEKRGGSRLTKSMRDFSNLVSTLNLVDLPLNGDKYTWSNGQAHPTMYRLDRFLISTAFENKYPQSL